MASARTGSQDDRSQDKVFLTHRILPLLKKRFSRHRGPQPSSPQMPTFDMVVVGSGGGPDETDLSSYLIKPHDAAWEDGIISLEAGSGMGVLKTLLSRNPNLFTPASGGNAKKLYTASEIYSYVRCFLITHAHLDHVNSLIISAGSLGGQRKSVFAANQTLKDLEGIFADRIWPNLASWKEHDEPPKLLYSPLRADGVYRPIFPDVSVLMMPVSHGNPTSKETYESAAYFLRHDPTTKEFLFFGDVEPDTIAQNPQTIKVWRMAASKIPDTLSTIFIECSWTSGRKDETLYGHLTPEHLVAELTALAGEVVRFRQHGARDARPSSPKQKKMRPEPFPAETLRGALDGLRVHVIHCKDPMETSNRPISHIICDQISDLLLPLGLGVQILPTNQGTRIYI